MMQHAKFMPDQTYTEESGDVRHLDQDLEGSQLNGVCRWVVVWNVCQIRLQVREMRGRQSVQQARTASARQQTFRYAHHHVLIGE